LNLSVSTGEEHDWDVRRSEALRALLGEPSDATESRLSKIALVVVCVVAVVSPIVVYFLPEPGKGSPASTWAAAGSGIAGLAAAILAAISVRLISRIPEDQREKDGKLAITGALKALDSCETKSFGKEALKARRKLNKEIDRLAATVEAIPKNLGSYDPRLIDEAQRRGAALREVHLDVATLTDDSKAYVRDRLISLKERYDSGLWTELPSTDVVTISRPVLISVRLSFGLLAAICLSGIVYILVTPTHLPAGGVSILTFILGTLGLGFLSRAQLLTPTSQQVIELVTKAQDAMKPAPAEGIAHQTTPSTDGNPPR
jgi:hypothetical protein